MTAAAEQNEVLGYLATTARVIHRFSTWVAGAALVVGLITLASLWPWFSGSGSTGFTIGVVLTVVLVAAPVRVMWHGRIISAAYGHPSAIEQALEAVPGALHEATVALDAVADKAIHGRGLRRAIGTWQSLRAMQKVWEESPAAEKLQNLVDPIHPDRLGVTMAAVWVSLGTLVLGIPVALASQLALAVT